VTAGAGVGSRGVVVGAGAGSYGSDAVGSARDGCEGFARSLLDRIRGDRGSDAIFVVVKDERKYQRCPFCVATETRLRDLRSSGGLPQSRRVRVGRLPSQACWDAFRTAAGVRTVPAVFVGGVHRGGSEVVREIPG